MERKSYKAAVKVNDAGHVVVRFAKLNVVDKGGDMTLPGAFQQGQEVRISAYNHSSWGSALPVGKGAIREEGDDAIFEGDFFLETQAGKEHYLTVKAMGPLQEWSYGFNVLNDGHTDVDGTQIRLLKTLDTFEVSPVLLGQGIGTQTLDVKGSGDDPELKGAVPYQKTDVIDVPFDGPKFEARIPNDAGRKVLRQYNAWVDPKGDPDKKNAYKMGHHFVGTDGKVGAAVKRGCIIGIAELNGARGGVKIPDADRKGVYDHLAHHLKDGGYEPPELRSWDDVQTKGARFSDEAVCVLADVTELAGRAQAIKAMREKKGEDLGAESRALLAEIRAEVEALLDELKSLGDEPPTAEADALEALATAAIAEAALAMTRVPQ